VGLGLIDRAVGRRSMVDLAPGSQMVAVIAIGGQF